MKRTMHIFGAWRGLGISVLVVCMFWMALAKSQSKFQPGTYSNGDFSITFQDDGRHVVSIGNDVAVKGSYKITGDQIVLVDKEGQYACDGEGKYKWKLEGKVLTFEKIADGCEGRSNALVGQQWTQK